MASKLISVTEKAYSRLMERKTNGKSFSKVILEITEAKGDISKYIGAWSKQEADELRAEIKKTRKTFSKGLRKREHVLFG